MQTFKLSAFVCLIFVFLKAHAASLYQNTEEETSEQPAGFSLANNYNKETSGHSLVSEYRGKVWHELSNAFSYGWNSVVSLTGSVTNRSIYAYKHLSAGKHHTTRLQDSSLTYFLQIFKESGPPLACLPQIKHPTNRATSALTWQPVRPGNYWA